MRMRGTKPIFSYRDTWDLDDTLRPIIAAGVRHFLETIKKKDNVAGCPCNFTTVNGEQGYKEEDFEGSLQRWYETLEEIVWAFESKEPCISQYGFKIEMVPLEGDESNRFTTEISDEAEWQRYREDLDAYHIRRQAGYDLFSKNLSAMWW